MVEKQWRICSVQWEMDHLYTYHGLDEFSRPQSQTDWLAGVCKENWFVQLHSIMVILQLHVNNCRYKNRNMRVAAFKWANEVIGLNSTAWLWHTILRPGLGLWRSWWEVSRNQVYSSLKHWGWVQVNKESRESHQTSGGMLIELVKMQKHLSHQHTTNTGAHDCWGAKVNLWKMTWNVVSSYLAVAVHI